MYYSLCHQHQYLKGCCTLQHLVYFGLFLMLRGSNTLFSVINPFTEGDAVLSTSNLIVGGKKKHCLHFYFSLLYVARRFGTENFPIMSHCVYEQGRDAVRQGNVSLPSLMKSVHSFQAGTAASYPQNRAVRKENPLSLVALTLFQREL